MTHKWIVIFFWGFFSLINAQEPTGRWIGTEQGLPDNTVFSIHQDSFGLIWLGTSKGLYQYDGFEFEEVENPTNKGKGVYGLREDSNGNLWYINLAGDLFYTQNGKIHYFNQIPPDFEANYFYPNNENSGWLISPRTNQALKIDYNDFDIRDKITQFPILNGIYEKGNGQKFIVTSDSLILYNNTKRVLAAPFEMENKTNSELLVFFEGLSENVFADHINQPGIVISKLKMEADTFSLEPFFHLKTPKVLRTNFFKEFDGFYWIGHANGVHQIEAESGKIIGHFFKNKNVISALKDKEGQYWFSIYQKGLFVVPSIDFVSHNSDNNSLPNDFVSNLKITQNGNTLIGLSNGYFGVFESIESSRFLQDKSLIKCNDIEEFNSGQYAFLSSGFDIWLTDNAFKKHQNITLNRSSAAKQLTVLDNNEIIVGNYDNFSLYTLQNNRAQFQKYLLKKRCILIYNTPYSDRCWLGSTNQLFFYEGGTVYPFHPDSFKHGIKDILQTQDLTTWIATTESGILLYKKDKLIDSITIQDGLPSNYCTQVKADPADENLIWICTEKGITRYNRQTKALDIINSFDGLIRNEVMTLAVDADKVWAGTSEGLTIFRKDAIRKNITPPGIQISQIKIWEQDTTIHTDYRLHHSQNNLMIGFRGIAFRSNGSFKYRYRMLGLNDNWTEVKSSTGFARYPSLPSGDFEFQVVAVNEDGVASTHPASVKISIATPYWKHVWFIALLIFGTLFLIGFGFMTFIRNLNRKHENERMLRQAQLSSLKSQMNPHFLFNTLNSIQYLIAKKDLKEANQNLYKFSTLMRTILELSEKEEITLEEELEALKLYLELEKLRFESKLEYSFKVDQKLDKNDILLPALIIQPYVENALKHGLFPKNGNGHILIDINMVKNGLLVCTVKDDGIGRAASMRLKKSKKSLYESKGISLTQRRLQLLNKQLKNPVSMTINDLKDNNGQASGTEIILYIPCKSIKNQNGKK